MSRAGTFRHDAKRDTAERPIIDALRAVGCEVTQVSGKGAPDLLVRRGGHGKGVCVGLEVKTGKGKQTDAQKVTDWPIVRTVDEAFVALGIAHEIHA